MKGYCWDLAEVCALIRTILFPILLRRLAQKYSRLIAGYYGTELRQYIYGRFVSLLCIVAR